MKYMFLLYGDESMGETPSQMPAERAAEWTEFHEMAAISGRMVGWNALEPSASARTVRPGGGRFVDTDGPYAESKEQLGGFYILECTDFDEAMALAKKMPCSAHGGVEVRPMLDTDDA